MNTHRVDFSYAFGTPHRLTVAMPESSDKTLLDMQPGSLRMAWTYDNLVRFPLSVYAMPQTNWDFNIKPTVDGTEFKKTSWTRMGGFIPVLENMYNDLRGNVRLWVAGGKSAAMTRIEITNTDKQPHVFELTCTSKESLTAGYNPAWIDETEYSDVLLAGWRERADRVLFLAIGAQELKAPAAHVLQMVWTVLPGQTVSGWLIRPYNAVKADIPAFRVSDWAKEFDDAVEVWKNLISRASDFKIPDPGVRNGFYACLTDLFVMREPVASGYLAGTAGTEVYRAPNNAEPAVMAICLDQMGYHTEAELGYRMCLDLQGEDGDWADPMAWSNHWWSSSGFKSWAVMEHFYITRDRAYLENVYPKMLASSRFQEKMRTKTRKFINGQKPLTYGLMPRGQGDCGLVDGDDYYGVYYPHNFWATFADGCTYAAAKILNRPELKEVELIYQTALKDLLASLENGAIEEEGYRWIPGAPGKTTGSRWGALNALYPCQLLPADHELITGTIMKMESQMSPGGIPIHTGWQKDGMWVAMTLDNLAQALLVRGESEKVGEYLYATLNHGTPVYTWCEERGQLPGDTNCTGDRQHLFTPVAVIRCVRDMFVMEEDDGLHIGRAVHRSWLVSGQVIGVRNAPTHFGEVSWELQYDKEAGKISGWVEFPESSLLSWAKVHVRLPEDKKIKSVVSKSTVTVSPDTSVLDIPSPKGKIELEIFI
jgi:hypothetical protein